MLFNGYLVVADSEGYVHWINTLDGRFVAQQKLDSDGFQTEPVVAGDRLLIQEPVIVNGVVYALAYNGNLTALDLRSGQIMWKREIGGVKDLIVDAGRIYLVDQDDRVIALNADGGVARVNLDMPALSLRGESAPAVAFGGAIVGGDNGRVSAVILNQGQLIWQQRISQPSGATEIDRLSDVDTSGDRIYIGSERGQVFALNSSDGSLTWQTKVAGEALSRPVVSDGLVLVHTSNGMLQGLDQSSGAVKWTDGIGDFYSNLHPEWLDGTVYAADRFGVVKALDASNGKEKWKVDLSEKTGFFSKNISALLSGGVTATK
ncbi:hypothetical protein CRX72_25165 [Pantoea sp. BRM17]|nr:hypothetical protein CRX72_25165 [Pantoea sp. BRM17]